MGGFAVLALAIFAALLIGAVVLGLRKNHKSKGEPSAGRDSDGTPRAS